ncbi:hypothetical protein Moror_2382, partial [Moniliophthora roreri MCA 2997]
IWQRLFLFFSVPDPESSRINKLFAPLADEQGPANISSQVFVVITGMKSIRCFASLFEAIQHHCFACYLFESSSLQEDYTHVHL